MKFLLDQDVYVLTARFLRDLGHDVVTAAELGLARAADETLLRRAGSDKRLFVTRDRDIGGLVFVKAISVGVLYLRIRPSTLSAVHAEIAQILVTYTETQLHQAFLVVMPGGYRIRKLNPESKDL